MINWINAFIDDTLKIKGKFSIKRVLVAIFTPYTLYIGVFIVKNKDINPFAINVFTGLLGFITLIVAGTIYAKKQEIKNTNDTENTQ